MVLVKIYVRDINYNTVVDTAMPFIAKGLTDKDNIFLNVVKKIISNHGKPTGLSKLLVSVIPNKDNVAVSILGDFDEDITEFLNDLLRKNNIVAVIKALSFKTIERSHGKMLKIEITVDDIDYEHTITNLAPSIIAKLAEQDNKAGKIARLMLEEKELPVNILMAALGAIPKPHREELLVDILMQYREELTDTLNAIIAKNNIKAEIKGIKIISMDNSKQI